MFLGRGGKEGRERETRKGQTSVEMSIVVCSKGELKLPIRLKIFRAEKRAHISWIIIFNLTNSDGQQSSGLLSYGIAILRNPGTNR